MYTVQMGMNVDDLHDPEILWLCIQIGDCWVQLHFSAQLGYFICWYKTQVQNWSLDLIIKLRSVQIS